MIQVSERKLVGLLMLEQICKAGDPPFPEFLEWIAARLVLKGDSEIIDFVQQLKRQARKIEEAQLFL